MWDRWRLTEEKLAALLRERVAMSEKEEAMNRERAAMSEKEEALAEVARLKALLEQQGKLH